MADNELAAKLARRQQAIDSDVPVENGDVIEDVKVIDDSEENLVPNNVDDELRQGLQRRQLINDGVETAVVKAAPKNLYSEFHEFSRKQIKNFEDMFKKFDVNRDGFIDFEELKRMMELLGAPQTHLSLKEMIRQVDEDQDSKISMREFCLIFRKAAAGDLLEGSGLSVLTELSEIDVAKEGVGGAKTFFEAKIDQITRTNKFEEEIKQEQQEKRQLEEEKKVRRNEFKEKQAIFK